MVIISRAALHKFNSLYPVSAGALNDWYFKTKAADWKNLNDIKQVFNSCDYIGNDRYVFDIMGNNYRLIALIHFSERTLYIRGVMTHDEYDRATKSGKLKDL